jgi:riboflavin kinase/FMN adenylyltransferase
MGGEAVVLTFDPHPAAVIRGLKVSLLCALERRLDLIGRQNIDTAILLRFDKALASQTAEAFLSKTLLGVGLKGLVLGYDSHFGHDREGDLAMARRLGPGLGFEVRTVEAVPVGGRAVSSRRIREALAAGDLEDARACLGRPWALEGRVTRGDGRGRTLGFPTANLDMGDLILPRTGVYAGSVTLEGKAWKAAVNVGFRPTVGRDSVPSAELHVAGWSGDLYGKPLSVDLLRRLRDERRFESLEALRGQIARDLEALSG